MFLKCKIQQPATRSRAIYMCAQARAHRDNALGGPCREGTDRSKHQAGDGRGRQLMHTQLTEPEANTPMEHQIATKQIPRIPTPHNADTRKLPQKIACIIPRKCAQSHGLLHQLHSRNPKPAIFPHGNPADHVRGGQQRRALTQTNPRRNRNKNVIKYKRLSGSGGRPSPGGGEPDIAPPPPVRAGDFQTGGKKIAGFWF